MKRNFVNVARFLEDEFPELRGKISGEHMPPPPAVELVSKILSAAQLFGLFWIVFGGATAMKLLGFQPDRLPALYHKIQENAMTCCVILFFILPQFVNMFVVSGAFEIYVDDDKLVWSKLKTGNFPTQQELIAAVQQYGIMSRAAMEAAAAAARRAAAAAAADGSVQQ